MRNRAGRQAVVARTIVDATDRAVVARLAGARFAPYPAGMHTFTRVVIGGEVCQGENLSARQVDPPFRGPAMRSVPDHTGVRPVIEYTLRLPMEDDSWASWATTDQLVIGQGDVHSGTYDVSPPVLSLAAAPGRVNTRLFLAGEAARRSRRSLQEVSHDRQAA